MADKYLLHVAAGSSYDQATHQIVPVNVAKPITIDTEYITVDLNVRIKSYRGLPFSSPSSSPYFLLPEHAKNDDKYSISFAFTLKSDMSGNDLVFGNDFDYPIRDRLPIGFGTAFKIVKWMIDPGLDGDVYADQPYLYGPVASSFNTLYVGSKNNKVIHNQIDEDVGLLIAEGGTEDGCVLRKEKGVPDSEASRKKYFLNEENRKNWVWEAGREYGVDFYNPYLDFNDFALRLPGFTLSMINYWDGQSLRKIRKKYSRGIQIDAQKRSHSLRYTLKNRATNTVLFVVVITLTLKEDVDRQGIVKSLKYTQQLGLTGRSSHRYDDDKTLASDEHTNISKRAPNFDDEVD